MSANRLEMHNISLAFSGFQALNKVDFTLHGGSVHALTGANGAGKSTLMAVLCGTHAHYEGEVTINNLPVTIRSPRPDREFYRTGRRSTSWTSHRKGRPHRCCHLFLFSG